MMTTNKRRHPQADDFCDKIKNGDMFNQLSISSHATDLHVGNSDLELLERMLDEQLPLVSSFKSNDIYETFTKNILYHEMSEILDWRDDPETKDHSTKPFIMPFWGEDVGTGFIKNQKNNTIKEYKTEKACLVLRKCNANRGVGLDIVTAYPYMPHNKVTTTGKDLRPIIEQTKEYQNASPAKKTILSYQTNPNSMYRAEYKPGNYSSDDMIHMIFPTNKANKEHHIDIKEDRYRLQTCYNNVNIQTDWTKLQDEIHPSKSKKPNTKVDLFNKTLRDKVSDDCPILIKTTLPIVVSLLDHKKEQEKEQASIDTKIDIKNQQENIQQIREKQVDNMVADLKKPDKSEFTRSKYN